MTFWTRRATSSPRLAIGSQDGQERLGECQQQQHQHAVDGVPVAPAVTAVQEQTGQDRLGEHRQGKQPEHYVHHANDC
jgi:hypothetical protein